MEIAITKMSSKGQVVVPAEMRRDIKEGEKMIIIKTEEGQIIMKKATEMDEKLKDDIIFAKRTEAAIKRYERGEFTSSSAEDFLKQLKKW
ncbi:MAG: AbrB/MazE/SpoVT family DNA-binding domain-containing protein [archaeon]